MTAGTTLVEDAVLEREYGEGWEFHRDHMDPDGEMGRLLRAQLFAYCTPSDFVGHRVLDFGSGEGGSAFIMSSLLPESGIVGVELNATQVERATRLARSAGRAVTFRCSPRGTELPPDLGTFQFIMLSAVYEHLLPEERREVLPRLWAHLNVGGILFVNQTPHRWFPYEHHSTGLWGINYLPNGLAMRATRFA
ncbi:MAG TPA: class I SAM-dependent methyltransferase, partial [Gemmatimonadales bacterium]|nr:class I SAM-dependent methyltransferase [Gemmatimonadales bacterium]